MGLRVRFVTSLNEIVDPVVDYLSSNADAIDLFDSHHLIVPTAGVRAWLAPKISARLGATVGANDGVLMNTQVGYIGMLNGILRNGIEDESDAWSIERVTMAILRVIHVGDPVSDQLVLKYAGPLRAARAIADRFDRYAARRPQMIREWERAHSLNEVVSDDDARIAWQCNLWCKVRDIIGVPSWPARTEELCARLGIGEVITHLPTKLMVAGIETVSVANLEILKALSAVINVDVICVHPSPYLLAEWAIQSRSARVTPGVAPRRENDAHVLPGADVLVTTWLRGAYELQMLLASQGIACESGALPNIESNSPNLLHRMQNSVVAPHLVSKRELVAADRSVQIHRAHNLARQVEILRDVLLHAFNDLDNLHPHEVIVLCANIESAAPLLQATFDHPITLSSGAKVQIPFVVADRSLRDISPGADLLADVLTLVGSRFDVTSVVRIAMNDLILRNMRLGQEDVNVWVRYISTTRVRWGLDVEQRKIAGLDAEEISAHSWKQMLDRALLGALLPDAETPTFELGGVVPLTQVDASEIDALTGLAEILAVVAKLESKARELEPIGYWCDQVEELLVALCGDSCTEIDDALAVIEVFREATLLPSPTESLRISEAVRFGEFADLLTQKLSAKPGRQPLRTGAVTATSFVPLRGVPFRVVCIVGLDDGTLTIGESEGDDIIANEQLMGDADPRVDTRRILLDAVVAAKDQLIITCNGRSIKNNTPVPLVTPLAEILDLCGRLGVDVPSESDKPSQIEHIHPRHASGTANFVAINGPVDGVVWSHDAAALASAKSRDTTGPSVTLAMPQVELRPVIALKKLETLMIDPLDYYLRESLGIFTEYEEPKTGAVLPIEMSEVELGRLAEALVKAAPNGNLDEAKENWKATAEASDTLPVGKFADRELDLAVKVASAVRGGATTLGIPISAPDPIEFVISFSDGTSVDCHIANVVEDSEKGIVYTLRYDTYTDKEITRMAMRLIALRAAGKNVRQAIVAQRDNNQSHWLANVIDLNDDVTQEVALKRLHALAIGERFARVTPCGLFGETAAEIANVGTVEDGSVIEAFEAFVDNERSFKKSKECLVYGANPRIDEALPPNRVDVVEFFQTFVATCPLEKDDVKKDGLQKWVVM